MSTGASDARSPDRQCFICGREVDEDDYSQLLVDVRSPLARSEEVLPFVVHGLCFVITTDSSVRSRRLHEWAVRQGQTWNPDEIGRRGT
jgi:uncharacterized protein (UPF0276 family)